jgi:hypothetical protein
MVARALNWKCATTVVRPRAKEPGLVDLLTDIATDKSRGTSLVTCVSYISCFSFESNIVISAFRVLWFGVRYL